MRRRIIEHRPPDIDGEPDNDDRAEMALALIETWGHAHYWGDMRMHEPGQPPIAYHVSDLLADIMHPCDRIDMVDMDTERRHTFDELVEAARNHYDEELSEEE